MAGLLRRERELLDLVAEATLLCGPVDDHPDALGPGDVRPPRVGDEASVCGDKVVDLRHGYSSIGTEQPPETDVDDIARPPELYPTLCAAENACSNSTWSGASSARPHTVRRSPRPRASVRWPIMNAKATAAGRHSAVLGSCWSRPDEMPRLRP